MTPELMDLDLRHKKYCQQLAEADPEVPES